MMLRILFSGPILGKEQNTGRPQCWTYNRRDGLDKNNNGERKKTLQLLEERQKHNHIFTESIWSGPSKTSLRPLGWLSVNCTSFQDVRPPGHGGVRFLPLQDVG